ncbi:hypothetical protein PLESTM_001678800 [Pleodorina starrii]|nr:hypothetical protein PLESTM_001678800 [Pleodorina starrii]
MQTGSYCRAASRSARTCTAKRPLLRKTRNDSSTYMTSNVPLPEMGRGSCHDPRISRPERMLARMVLGVTGLSSCKYGTQQRSGVAACYRYINCTSSRIR